MSDQSVESKIVMFQEENAKLKKLVRQLKAAVLKLENKIVKIEVDYFVAKARVKALEKVMPLYDHLVWKDNLSKMSEEELDASIKEFLDKAGLTISH